MTNTNPTFMGLDFQPVDLKDLKGSIKTWCDERRNQMNGTRYFILIQDRDGGGYEVIKNNHAWPCLRKVALGYVSAHLKRKYGQDQVADNINVWIAEYQSDTWKQELENYLLGRWANVDAQAARARKIAEAIANSVGRQKFWAENAPEAFAWLKDNKYL